MAQSNTERELQAHNLHPFPRANDDDKIGGGLVAGSSSDPELEGLTLYEKKALLVNRELDRQGMGRYQWMVLG